MRTQNEILEKLKELKIEGDVFGVKSGDLIEYLEYENVKSFLKEGVTEEEWEPRALTEETVKKEMSDYMEFAWGKANDCRGLSAGRSMCHYTAWVWLLGDDAVKRFGDLEEYEYYGKENLGKLCKFLELDSSKWDDGVRSNTEY